MNTHFPRFLHTALALGLACAPGVSAASASDPAPDETISPRTTGQILDASSLSDWRALAPEHTLYLELEQGRVIIELSADFAPQHVANIRTLAGEGYWDGQTIYRVQDNYVVQFGALPGAEPPREIGSAKAALPAEFERSAQGVAFHALPDVDGWAAEVGFVNGFPAGRDGVDGALWMAHCYGALGAGRDNAPDSSNGTELYVIIGQSPRQLDRNITLVGRVVKGMELLSSLPRGTGVMGFYDDPAQYVPIRSLRLASDVAPERREALEILRTDTPLFDAFVESRRNRYDAWNVRPAGHVDLCNIAIPVRSAANQ